MADVATSITFMWGFPEQTITWPIGEVRKITLVPRCFVFLKHKVIHFRQTSSDKPQQKHGLRRASMLQRIRYNWRKETTEVLIVLAKHLESVLPLQHPCMPRWWRTACRWPPPPRITLNTIPPATKLTTTRLGLGGNVEINPELNPFTAKRIGNKRH